MEHTQGRRQKERLFYALVLVFVLGFITSFSSSAPANPIVPVNPAIPGGPTVDLGTCTGGQCTTCGENGCGTCGDNCGTQIIVCSMVSVEITCSGNLPIVTLTLNAELTSERENSLVWFYVDPPPNTADYIGMITSSDWVQNPLSGRYILSNWPFTLSPYPAGDYSAHICTVLPGSNINTNKCTCFTFSLTVPSCGNPSNQVIDILNQIIITIDGFSPGFFKNPNMRSALTNKINAVLKLIDQGLYIEALDKLQNDILQKTDGCATGGGPDKNDWIINCTAQGQVYPLIMEAIQLLGGLI